MPRFDSGSFSRIADMLMAHIESKQLTLDDGRVVTLRSARVEDAAGLLENLHAITRESDQLLMFPGEVRYTVEQEAAWVREHLEHPRSMILVAEVDGRIVGCLDFRPGERRKQHHYGSFGIALRQAYRGRGVGSAMIQMMLDWAAAHPQIEKVGLSVFSTNQRAIALYERLGFVEVGRSPHHFRLGPDNYADNIIMCRFVKPAPGAAAPPGRPGAITASIPPAMNR